MSAYCVHVPASREAPARQTPLQTLMLYLLLLPIVLLNVEISVTLAKHKLIRCDSIREPVAKAL